MSEQQYLPTRNPRTGAIDYQMPVDDAAAVAATAAALRASQPAWVEAGVADRAAALEAFAHALQLRREPMLAALAADTGRWTEGLIELDATLGAMHRWCKLAPELMAQGANTPTSVPHISFIQGRIPFVLTGVISPWNFPLLLSLIDALPALLAGCTVLIKPSEVTPRFVPVLRAALGDTSFFSSRRHPVRRFINRLASLACAFERAAQSLCWASMVNAGQSCMSLERCYVERNVYERFAEALRQRVAALRLNWPDIRVGEIGPVIAAPQAEIIRTHLADAYALGARALTGGQVVERDGGFWCEPTVLVDATSEMQVVREETFAPVLPLLVFDTEEEAIALANATDYGLSAAVFSGDEARALRVAQRLLAGGISINDASLTALLHEGGKQSFGSSGLGGTRMGVKSIERFYRLQAYLINDGTPSPWWYR